MDVYKLLLLLCGYEAAGKTDSVNFGRFSISRRPLKEWFIYDGAKEYHFARDVTAETKGFASFEDALDYMLTLMEVQEWLKTK